MSAPNLQPVPGTDHDYLTLVDVWRIVARRWLLVASACGLGLLIGVAYLFVATPRYEVDVLVDRPFESQIVKLNLGRTEATGLPPFSGDQVFTYFVHQLRSEMAFQRFFREIYRPSLSEKQRAIPESRLYKEARKMLAVKAPSGKGQDRALFAITVAADSPVKARAWLDQFLGQVEEDARKTFLDNVRVDLDVGIANAAKDLAELRLTAGKIREDRVLQLSEAVTVAKAINLRDPLGNVVRQQSADQASQSFIDGSTLYARGEKSLSAELSVLKARGSDDAFIPGLRDAESKLRMWKAVAAQTPTTLPMYRVDGEAMAPVDPVWPRMAPILALCVVLGLMAGLLLAFAGHKLAGSGRPQVLPQ